MFFIFFFHFFSEEKVSSFLFSCISFKYVLLLALVSEFDCFLRSRAAPWSCGVPERHRAGKLGLGWAACLGREHASTPQSGVEAPRLLLLLLLLCCMLLLCCFFGHNQSESRKVKTAENTEKL